MCNQLHDEKNAKSISEKDFNFKNSCIIGILLIIGSIIFFYISNYYTHGWLRPENVDNPFYFIFRRELDQQLGQLFSLLSFIILISGVVFSAISAFILNSQQKQQVLNNENNMRNEMQMMAQRLRELEMERQQVQMQAQSKIEEAERKASTMSSQVMGLEQELNGTKEKLKSSEERVAKFVALHSTFNEMSKGV